MAPSIFSKPCVSTIRSGGDAVYVAAVPLRAAGGPAQLLMSTAYSLNLRDFQHLMVVIKPSSPPCSKVIVFDFQPRNPESKEAAIAVLSRKSVPGVVLQRTLKGVPRSKCWYVGPSLGNALDMAVQFNASWETDLRVGYHDCRDYTNGKMFDSFLQHSCGMLLWSNPDFEFFWEEHASDVLMLVELVEHLTGEKQVLKRLWR